MSKLEVKIIEISYVNNDYLIRSQDHFLQSIFRGSLLECIGYAQVSKLDVINTEQVQQFFKDPEKIRGAGPGEVVYDYIPKENKTWRESNVLSVDEKGVVTISIDGVPLKGIAQLSVNQDITRAHAGIAYVKLEMHVSTKTNN